MENLYQKCSGCGGSGVNSGSTQNEDGSSTPVETPCTRCEGDGLQELGSLSDEFMAEFEKANAAVDYIKKKIKVILQHLELPTE